MVTEEEARKKWCPFVRLMSVAKRDGKRDTAVTAFNRIALTSDAATHDMSPAAARCIASECMAWRWGEIESENDGVYEGRLEPGEFNPPFAQCPPGYEVTSYNSASFCAVKNHRNVVKGWCGLAGKP